MASHGVPGLVFIAKLYQWALTATSFRVPDLRSFAVPLVSALTLASVVVPDLMILAEFVTLALALASSLVPVFSRRAAFDLLAQAIAGAWVLDQRRDALPGAVAGAGLVVEVLGPHAILPLTLALASTRVPPLTR